MKTLDSVLIVLVNPEDSGNIGSVCRAMKTMGITRLAIVESCKIPADHDENKIKYIAVHAFDIYEKRECCSTLEDAVKNCTISIAATRRTGKRRKYRTFLPDDIYDFIFYPGSRPALVFGNEAKGLTDSELSVCSAAVEIPSSPDFPSLNLSHAVQILTYTLYTSLLKNAKDHGDKPKTVNPRNLPAKLHEIENLSLEITENLKNIGFFKITGNDDIRNFLRDIFSRARINSFEKEKIKKLFNKITGMVKAGKGDM